MVYSYIFTADTAAAVENNRIPNVLEVVGEEYQLLAVAAAEVGIRLVAERNLEGSLEVDRPIRWLLGSLLEGDKQDIHFAGIPGVDKKGQMEDSQRLDP